MNYSPKSELRGKGENSATDILDKKHIFIFHDSKITFQLLMENSIHGKRGPSRSIKFVYLYRTPLPFSKIPLRASSGRA